MPLIKNKPKIEYKHHPAKFTDAILNSIRKHIKPNTSILDPFGGVGKVGLLNDGTHSIVSVEIEPEWGLQGYLHGCTSCVIRDSTDLRIFPDESFDYIVTSPPYGNRLSDCYQRLIDPEAMQLRSNQFRSTYMKSLGRWPSENSAARYYLSRVKYQEICFGVWKEAVRLLAKDGTFILNVKDFKSTTTTHLGTRTKQKTEDKERKTYSVSQYHLNILKELGMDDPHLTEYIYLPGNSNTVAMRSRGFEMIDYEYIFYIKKKPIPIEELRPHAKLRPRRKV